MVIKKAELETVCGVTSSIPSHSLPEVAFIGRSNVGKSSLINSLTGRKSLARTSGKPGKTQTINFYNINESIYIVDLPGYGYANAPKEVTDKWGDMVGRYFEESESLEVIFLLCDLRHPASKLDIEMFHWICYMDFQPIVIATKSDKVKPSQIKKNIRILKESLDAPEDTIIIPFSSETGEGKDILLDFLDQVIENQSI